MAGKNKASLITMISCYLQREELQELEDMGMSELLFFRDKIAEVAMAEHLTEPQAPLNEEKNGQDEAQDNIPQESRPPQL